MARRAIRRARELREQWLRELTGVVSQITGRMSYQRGSDYREAPDAWVCNRKKAYPTESMAARVAAGLNSENMDEATAREGFYGVVVVPYGCGRCGFWHLGR